MGQGQGAKDAAAAAQTQTQLFHEYGAAGVPALQNALGYASAASQRGLPAYVQNAYGQAQAGALEQNVQNSMSLRQRLLGGSSEATSGGQYLSGLSQVASSAGDAYSREMTQIGTGRAVAGVEQRNKLLNVLAGGGATGTSLSASFGQLGNQAISLEPQSPTFGLAMGGLSAGLGIYSALSQANAQSASQQWGQNNYQYGNGAVGTAGALSRLPLG